MLVFDLETDGLLNDVTCIHCMVIYDSEADETYVYNDQGDQEPIVRGVQLLEEAKVICGHNVIGYDLPVIEKIYPWFKPAGFVLDTLLLSRLYHTNMMELVHSLRVSTRSCRIHRKWLLMYAKSVFHSSCVKYPDYKCARYKCARCYKPVSELGACRECLCEIHAPSFPLGRVVYGPLIAALLLTALTLVSR